MDRSCLQVRGGGIVIMPLYFSRLSPKAILSYGVFIQRLTKVLSFDLHLVSEFTSKESQTRYHPETNT